MRGGELHEWHSLRTTRGKKKKNLSWEVRLSHFLAKRSAGSKEAVAQSSSLSSVHVLAMLAATRAHHANSNMLLAPSWSSHFAPLQKPPCLLSRDRKFTLYKNTKRGREQQDDSTLHCCSCSTSVLPPLPPGLLALLACWQRPII